MQSRNIILLVVVAVAAGAVGVVLGLVVDDDGDDDGASGTSSGPSSSLPAEPATTGSVGSDGDPDEAPTTTQEGCVEVAPGDDVQALVDAAPEGREFCILAGVHEGQTITPKTGQRFVGEPGAVLDGGGTTAHAFVTTAGADAADDVVIRGLEITGYVSPDRCGDYYPTCGDEPIRGGAIFPHNHWNQSQQPWVPDLELSSNDWVVENNVIRGNQGTAVSVSNGMIVRDNLIAENSVLGVGGGTVIDVVVEGNEFRDNSIDPGIDPLQEAGALKLGAARGLRLAGNVVVGGGGPGLWCDIDCQDVVIEGNDISGLSGIGAVGISYEASSDAVIRGNVVSDVRWECRPESGIGIHVFDSRDVEVTGNTTTEVDNHVIVTQDDRRRAPADINYWQLAVADDVDFLWRTEDVTVRGNTMIGGGDQCQVGGVVGQSRGAVGVAIRHTGDHPNLVDVTDSIVWVDNDYDGTEDSLLFLWQQQDGSQAELRFADWSELGNR